MVDKEFISSIRKAIKANDIKTVEELIGDSKERLNTVFVFGSWLHETAELGYIELAKKLLDMGINIDLVANSYKGNAISAASSEGQTEMIKYLLSRGLKLDVSNTDGNPLFCAISGCHVETIKFLIEAGIDTTVNYAEDNDEPWTALELAKQYGNQEIINIIKNASKICNTIEKNEDDDIYEIENFIEKHIGEVDSTIEGIPLIDNMRMNVHIINPYESKEYRILMTDGMSSLPLSNNSYVEIMVSIPKVWADELLENQRDESKEVHWIFKWLIYLSYIPHRHRTIVINGLPCPTSMPPKPIFQGTEMTSFMYVYPREKKYRSMNVNGKNIDIFEVVPLYEDEYQTALQKSGEYIIGLFNYNSISTRIDWKRKKLV